MFFARVVSEGPKVSEYIYHPSPSPVPLLFSHPLPSRPLAEYFFAHLSLYLVLSVSQAPTMTRHFYLYTTPAPPLAPILPLYGYSPALLSRCRDPPVSGVSTFSPHFPLNDSTNFSLTTFAPHFSVQLVLCKRNPELFLLRDVVQVLRSMKTHPKIFSWRLLVRIG